MIKNASKGEKLWPAMPVLNVEKRFRDKSGLLTVSTTDLHDMTRDEANAYYVSGNLYVADCTVFECIREMQKTSDGDMIDTIRFESGDRSMYCIPENMGSFLPDVASSGSEIIALDDPRIPTYDNAITAIRDEIEDILDAAVKVVNEEITVFRRFLLALSPNEIYNNSLMIYCAEQIHYFFAEYVDTCDEDARASIFSDDELDSLQLLTEKNCVLKWILYRAMGQDSISMSSMDETERMVIETLIAMDCETDLTIGGTSILSAM